MFSLRIFNDFRLFLGIAEIVYSIFTFPFMCRKSNFVFESSSILVGRFERARFIFAINIIISYEKRPAFEDV